MALNIEELLINLLHRHDPSLDVQPGSPLHTNVVLKAVEALQHDPYAPNISKMVRARIEQEHNLIIRDGDMMDDALDKAAQTIFEPFRREIERISTVQSLRNSAVMTDDEIDAHMANRFVVRDEGDFYRVTVRTYFTSPTDVDIQFDNLARTDDGLIFVPTQLQSITEAGMSVQQDGAFYYMDIQYIAEEPGDDYKIEAGTIVEVDGLSAIRITNLAKSRDGAPRDSNNDLILTAVDGRAQKSLVVRKGISHLLRTEFAGRLRRLFSIGRNEPEMKRDIITSSGDYPVSLRTWVNFPVTFDATNNNFQLQTDVHTRTATIAVGGASSAFILADMINSAWIIAGGASYIAFPWVDGAESGITFHSDSILVGPSSLIQFLTVANPMYALFGLDSGFSQTLAGVVGTSYTGGNSGTLSLDGIPGGIVEPDTEFGEIIIPGNTVHIGGGATDVYVAGVDGDEELFVQTVVEHHTPLPVMYSLTTVLGSTEVEINILADWNNAKEGDQIGIYDGADAGIYTILEKYQTTGPDRYFFRLEMATAGMVASAAGLLWTVLASESVVMKLDAPGPRRIHATGLSGTVGSDIVSHTTLDFTALFLTAGDTLEITTGDNKGTYTVAQVVSAGSLRLTQRLQATDAAMQFIVYRTDTSISLPVRDIISVEEVDSQGRATGSIIPHAWPVDIRVIDEFSNLASGVKASGSLDTTAGDETVASLDFPADLTVGDRIHIQQGADQGFYRVDEIVVPGVVRLNKTMTATATGLRFVCGSPSVGTVRLYFLSPTTFEAYASVMVTDYNSTKINRAGTRFVYTDPSTKLEYGFESGQFTYQRVPERNGTAPTTLDRIDTETVESTSHDFNRLGVEIGDELVIQTGSFIGTYVIERVTNNQLQVVGTPFSSGFTGETFIIQKPYTQAMATSEMSDQGTEGPFYYFDIELVSEGAGDQYNIALSSLFTLDKTSHFYHEGWWLSSDNKFLSYSIYEKMNLHLTPYFLEDGLPESRDNRTLSQGVGLQIRFSRVPIVSEIQDFMLDSAHRNTNQDPLVRHLFPVFVYMATNYTGGSDESIVRSTLKEYIEGLQPDEEATVFQLLALFAKRSVTDVTSPLELVGIEWHDDRSISVVRSKDRLSTTRASYFLAHEGELSDVNQI